MTEVTEREPDPFQPSNVFVSDKTATSRDLVDQIAGIISTSNGNDIGVKAIGLSNAPIRPGERKTGTEILTTFIYRITKFERNPRNDYQALSIIYALLGEDGVMTANDKLSAMGIDVEAEGEIDREKGQLSTAQMLLKLKKAELSELKKEAKALENDLKIVNAKKKIPDPTADPTEDYDPTSDQVNFIQQNLQSEEEAKIISKKLNLVADKFEKVESMITRYETDVVNKQEDVRITMEINSPTMMSLYKLLSKYRGDRAFVEECINSSDINELLKLVKQALSILKTNLGQKGSIVDSVIANVDMPNSDERKFIAALYETYLRQLNRSYDESFKNLDALELRSNVTNANILVTNDHLYRELHLLNAISLAGYDPTLWTQVIGVPVSGAVERILNAWNNNNRRPLLRKELEEEFIHNLKLSIMPNVGLALMPDLKPDKQFSDASKKDSKSDAKT